MSQNTQYKETEMRNVFTCTLLGHTLNDSLTNNLNDSLTNNLNDSLTDSLN